jgi:signal peptidase I
VFNFKQTDKEKSGEDQKSSELTTTVRSIALFIWDLVKVFLVAFVLVWGVIRPFIAEPFVVSGSSMVPNFHNREYLIVEKISYRLHPPERGDVIVFRYPKDPTQYFIKRIIALPGERVTVGQGHVTIFNTQHPEGLTLDEQYLSNQDTTLGRPELVELGGNDYYVLGDNRMYSSDSRVWGALPKAEFIGKVWLRVLPISQFGLISHYVFPH